MVESAQVAIAAARGILLACEKTKLQEYGGPVLLGKVWAHSLLNLVGYGQTKPTTAKSKYDDTDFKK